MGAPRLLIYVTCVVPGVGLAWVHFIEFQNFYHYGTLREAGGNSDVLVILTIADMETLYHKSGNVYF